MAVDSLVLSQEANGSKEQKEFQVPFRAGMGGESAEICRNLVTSPKKSDANHPGTSLVVKMAGPARSCFSKPA